MRFYLDPPKLMSSMKETIANAGEDEGEREPYTHFVKLYISAITAEISMKSAQNNKSRTTMGS
jgi:hypothetical protein